MTVVSAILMGRSKQACEREAGRQPEAWLELLLGTTAAMLASDSALLLSQWAEARLGFAACLAILGVSVPAWRRPALVRVAIGLGAAALAWFLFCQADPVLRISLLALFFGGLHLGGERSSSGNGGRRESARFLALHLASLSYGVVLAAYERLDCLWFAARRLSETAAVWGGPAGLWASGLPIYIFGFLMVAWQVLLQVRGMRRAILLPACAGLFTTGLVVGGAIVCRTDLPGSVGVFLLHAVAIGVVAAVGAGAGATVRSGASAGVAADLNAPNVAGAHATGSARAEGLRSALLRMSPCWAVSLAVLAGLTIAGVALRSDCPAVDANDTQRPMVGPPKPASFAVYSQGLVDWSVPDSTRMGLLNSGMFGLFRRSLERCAVQTGGKVVMFGSETDSGLAGILKGTSVVVFINPTTAPSGGALLAIEDFVRSGGGLLVLGDHTDIMGSRRPLNAILSFTGMRFNFDSAVPLREHWRGCLEIRRHSAVGSAIGPAVRARERDPNLHLQIAVGASLEVKPPASPLVVGRLGFADAGNPLNGGQQAFMGDLRRGRGEQMGDIVLVAAEEVGLGKVLVFGDTSPFQNGALFLSQGVVADALAWLIGSGGSSQVPPTMPWSDQCAVIDFSTRPQASVSLFDDASLGGLVNCLAREGVAGLPAFCSAEWMPADSPLFIIGPTRMGEGELAGLLNHMERGGDVILAQGYASSQPCETLLRLMAFEIEDTPLGCGDPAGTPAHKDAYAIRIGARAEQAPERVAAAGKGDHGGTAPGLLGDATVVARAFGHPTVAVRRYGRGTLTLISDRKLLLDANLEGEQAHSRKNIRFVRDLLRLLRELDGSEPTSED